MAHKGKIPVKRRTAEEQPRRRERITPERYDPDYHEGLTTNQVMEHRLQGWRNLSVEAPSKTTKDIVRENTFTYFNLIFFVLAVLLIIVGSFRNLTFLPVIIGNTLIGIYQEIRAKNILDKMSMLNAPHAKVVRDGKVQQVASEDLVLDDIVIFSAGNQICADAIVSAGEVQVNESLLTGESDEITKRRGDQLMSGSFVISGKCHARLDKVGEDSYISKLTLEAKKMGEGEQSEMIRALDKLVKWVGIAIIPIGIILVVQSFFFNHDPFQSSVTSMVAAVIGMIPEGLYLLATVALAVSAMRLAKQQVLLHDMKSIETLARVNVLCVDKTGTITENTMAVHEAVETIDYSSGKEKEKYPPLDQMIGDFAAAMTADNITMEALKAFFTENTGKKAVSMTSFSSAVKYSSVTFEDGAYVLGAPEMVLRDDYILYEAEIEQYAKKGYRVLVFGKYEGEIDGKKLTEKVVPLGYVTLANPIRDKAKETFEYFAEQDVQIKVISGDNPMTVSEVAAQAGIAGAEHYVDASTLKTDEQVARAMEKYTVFGRVTPNQKRQFVHALQKAGNTVAMTGDGVNDVLALKEADCSIAMAEGSDAAKNIANVVLLDSNFAAMPEIVNQGRRVVNNIRTAASMFLIKTIFSVLLSLITIFFGDSYPFEPIQMSLISACAVGIPTFLLAQENNYEKIDHTFLRHVFMNAFPAAVTITGCVFSVMLVCQNVYHSNAMLNTACVLVTGWNYMAALKTVYAPLNKYRKVIIYSMQVIFFGAAVVLQNLLTLGSLEFGMIILVFLLMTFSPILIDVITAWLRNIYSRSLDSGEQGKFAAFIDKLRK